MLNHQIGDGDNTQFDPLIYESMTHNPEGYINAFVSRPYQENAHYGKGFYTAMNDTFYHTSRTPQTYAWTIFLKPIQDLAADTNAITVAHQNYFLASERRAYRIVRHKKDLSKFSFEQLLDYATLPFNQVRPSNEIPANSVADQNRFSNENYDALKLLRKMSRKLSQEQKNVFTRFVDTRVSALRISKIDSAMQRFIVTLIDLNFGENYLNDPTHLLSFSNERNYRSDPLKVAIAKSLLRQYRYSSDEHLNGKLAKQFDSLKLSPEQEAKLFSVLKLDARETFAGQLSQTSQRKQMTNVCREAFVP